MAPSNVVLASILLSTSWAVLLETNQSSSLKRPTDGDAPIFIAAGGDREEHNGRLSFANKGFNIPRQNVFTAWFGDKKVKDKTVGVTAGSYSKPAYESKPWSGKEFPYSALTGGEYRTELMWEFGKQWNKYQTKHDFKVEIKSKTLDKFPEPTDEEKETGRYGDTGFKESAKTNIYQITWYYTPTILASGEGIGAHNGILIISSHGNLHGEVSIGGALKAVTLDNMIRSGYGSQTMPHFIIILSCGAGQGHAMVQELASLTGSVVFVSKFIIGRSGSLPQMTFGLGGADPTSWAVREEFGEDGDPLNIGRTLCGKLGTEFSTHDINTWNQMKKDEGDDEAEFVGYFDRSLMDRDQHYFSWSQAGNKVGAELPQHWADDCKRRFQHSPPDVCQKSSPAAQRSCAQQREKNKRKPGAEWTARYGEMNVELTESPFGKMDPANSKVNPDVSTSADDVEEDNED